MAKNNQSSNGRPSHPIDKVRAARDGHSFHEAWAARAALELLPPKTTLIALAVEGFDVENGKGLSSAANEIADLVRYHVRQDSSRDEWIEVVQFKYSIANADKPIRAADLKKTLTKFAQTDRDLRAKYDDEYVSESVRYVFVTNRPIDKNLVLAIKALIKGADVHGDVAKRAKKLREYLTNDIPLVSFLERFDLQGSQGSLKDAEDSVRDLLFSWSGASDIESKMRLRNLQRLVQEKAGSSGQGNNQIKKIDVLAELGIDHEDELYPTPDAFPLVGKLIDRPLADQILKEATATDLPLLIHGAGGMGKTVLMQTIAERLSPTKRVVVFDGFGAGMWRAPEDGRHRPEKTLVHLANLLAGQGLCDLLLPTTDITALCKAFRRCLAQSVKTVRQTAVPDAGIVLLLDAIDHAGMEARDTGTESFAHLILMSLAVTPIDGVTVIASCRTERREIAVGDAEVTEIEVPPFSEDEAHDLICARDPTVTQAEMAALKLRSGMNPRCLDAFLEAGRPYDCEIPDDGGANASEAYDKLLEDRINNAKETAHAKGVGKQELNILLANLALLPPPVPMDELAVAQGLVPAEIESFTSDLAPLLERTSEGLIFRDEPTETLICSTYGLNENARNKVVERLSKRQDISAYACRALPWVLTSLRRTDELNKLAYDTRVPRNSSKVSQRNIRLARIVAAIRVTAVEEHNDDLIQLLLEASIVAAGHERSDRFLYEYPDLVAISGDEEAMRRLFSTKTGWPGGRHSARSLAHAFRGEMDEALRNSSRAMDWLDWESSNESSEPIEPEQASTLFDVLCIYYTELLAGNESRVVLALHKHSEAFNMFCTLLDFLERHDALKVDGFDSRTRILEHLQHCRLRSRSHLLAALKYSPGDPDYDRCLLKILGDLPPSDAESKVQQLEATLSAAAKALKLGMSKEARGILKEKVRTPRMLDYDRNFLTDFRVDLLVVEVGLLSLLRKSAPTLLDFAPTEFLEAVPKTIRRKGAAAFESELPKRLSVMEQRYRAGSHSTSRRSRSRRLTLSPESFDNYNRVIKHRIEPLISYASFVGELISPPDGKSAFEVMEAAITYLEKDLDPASASQDQDQKQYIARTCIPVFFQVGDAIGAFNPSNAGHLVTLIKKSQDLTIPTLMRMVQRLSRNQSLHDVALELASYVESLISKDTNINTCISSYGNLARAVWRVGHREAAAYFRQGLDLADAVGSDDFYKANYLMDLTSHYSGELLEKEAAHNLARILELNQHDPHKFPWTDFAKSMVPTAGLSTLALISRLDDRDHIPLSRTLSPMLSVLVKKDFLSSELASCVVGLEEPEEGWNWNLNYLAEVFCSKIPADKHEWLFQLLLTEIDRIYRLMPLPATIAGLKSLAEQYLDASSPALSRICTLAERNPLTENQPSEIAAAEVPFRFDGIINFGDPDALDKAIENDIDERNHSPARTLLHLAANVKVPLERLDFVRAVAQSRRASLSQKLDALDGYLKVWAQNSKAMSDELPKFALEIASKHATDLISDSWENTARVWHRLVDYFGGSSKELVREVISSLGMAANEISGDSWLSLAAKLASEVSRSSLRNGLNRYLKSSGLALPDKVGDGPWNQGFLTADTDLKNIATLIWVRLGNLKASSRWRAAHAIRRLAEIERYDVIDELAKAFHGQPQAFLHAGLPFYRLHAQLWFLIAIARITKDKPEPVLRWRDLLEKVAFDADSPHIVMQAFAKQALSSVAAVLPQEEATALLGRLANINKSPFPPGGEEENGGSAERPGEMQKTEGLFSQDYEFRKHMSSDMTDLFGLSEDEIDKELTSIIQTWDKEVKGMHECPRIHLRDNRNDSGSWSAPKKDRYGAYLAWHALMVLAGKLLTSKPVKKRLYDDDDDPWDSFLRKVTLGRPDGLWLSDITERFPLDLPSSITMPEREGKGWIVSASDRKVLSDALGLPSDGSLPEDILVSGYLDLGSNLYIYVRSVLVPLEDAESVALAAFMDDKPFQWLPSDAGDEEWRYGKNSRVFAWIETIEDTLRGIDQNDPYAATKAPNRPVPTEQLQKIASLAAADPIVGTWTSQLSEALRAEAWGSTTQRYYKQTDISGNRIIAKRAFLKSLIEKTGMSLVVFVRGTQYYPKEELSSDYGYGSYCHRTFAYIVEPQGRLRPITRMPKAAVVAIPKGQYVDFDVRYAALRKLKG